MLTLTRSNSACVVILVFPKQPLHALRPSAPVKDGRLGGPPSSSLGTTSLTVLQVVFGTMLVWSEVGFLRIFYIIVIFLYIIDFIYIIYYYCILLFSMLF